jgi:hypothetical protein
VNSSLLAATPGSAETDKAKRMADNVPKREMLLAFLRKGELNSK